MYVYGWKTEKIVKIFIGGLRDDANRYDIEDCFAKASRFKSAVALYFWFLKYLHQFTDLNPAQSACLLTEKASIFFLNMIDIFPKKIYREKVMGRSSGK